MSDLQSEKGSTSVGRMFERTLGKLYPIQWTQLTLEPDESGLPVPRFCWDFRDADSGVYARLREAIESFRGNAHWYLLDLDGNCIVALPYRLLPFRAMPNSETNEQTSAPTPSPSFSNHLASPGSDFINQAISDVPALCEAIEQRLELADKRPKPFEPGLRSATYEFRQPTHTVWLVKSIAAFGKSPGPTSELDRTLSLGLTYPEWRELFFDALGAEHKQYDKWLRERADPSTPAIGPTELESPIPGYPMLSRISGLLRDADFEAEEVRQLRAECLSVLGRTQNPLAVRALHKLVEISLEAEKLNLAVYLMAD